MATRDTDFYKVTLKSWLYERINQNKLNEVYRGLEWLDEEKLTFKLPWVTESDPNWRDYYKLFHDWASRSGASSRDSQKAKRNFRSALNHSKHFQLLKDKGKELQTGTYKVYKFLTQEEMKNQREAKQRNYPDGNFVPQGTLTPDPQNYNTGMRDAYMDTNGTGDVIVAAPQCDQMLNNMNTDFQGYQQHQQPVDMTPMNIPVQVQEYQMETMVSTGTDGDSEMQTIPSMDDDTPLVWGKLEQVGVSENDMERCLITIEYNGKLIDEREVPLSSGCKIKFGEVQNPEDNVIWLKRVDQAVSPGLHKILENMRRGIVFWYERTSMSIYMTRECLAHVYCFNMHEERLENGEVQSSGHPMQISKRRQEPYLVFSYRHLLSELSNRNLDLAPHQSMLSDTVDVVVGVQPKQHHCGRMVKGVKISLRPVGAMKISSCEDQAQLSDIKVSLEGSLPESSAARATIHEAEMHQPHFAT